MRLFEIDASEESIIYLERGFKTLVIPFTAWWNTEKIDPRFDWNIFRKMDVDILFVRDLWLSWYLYGLKGTTKDINSTVTYFNDVCSQYDKIITIGSSMGGYGSLLYGSLINHHNIHPKAFSPQINLIHWKVEGKLTKKDLTGFNKYSILTKSVTLPENTTIYYGQENKSDIVQMSTVDERFVELLKTDNHSSAQWLHARNKLVPLVETFV